MPPRARLLRVVAAASLAATAGCHEPTTVGNAARASAITAATMREWITRLAHDSLRGRATPSPGIEVAAAAVAASFRDAGLLGAFPGERYLLRHPAPPWGTGPDSAPLAGAILRGSDGRLAAEVVVVIAHLDGKGVGAPEGLDSIYNGADDNASGTAAVLELARVLASTAPHPRRTLLFLVVAGEEHGLWGSQYYVAHPTVPLDAISAVVNLDMISRNAPDSVQAGGMDRSTLGEVLYGVVAAHADEGLTVTPGPVSGSDQVPFSAAGVPFLFFFAGLHPDYHTPRDEADRVDADKAARVTRLAFHTILAVANAEGRPTWLPGGKPPAPSAGGAP